MKTPGEARQGLGHSFQGYLLADYTGGTNQHRLLGQSQCLTSHARHFVGAAQSLLTGAGVGDPGIDQDGAGALRLEMLLAEQYRRRRELVLGEHAGCRGMVVGHY